MSTHSTPAHPAPEPTSTRQYAAVPAKVDLASVDQQILALWAENDVFHRSLAQREGAPEWTFYEGPPTANGTPGTHHVEARVFKDVFPRFKTMRGYRVDRKAGWDCHGLPVELAVEKELGFTGKGDIEAYGVAEFNARCRESVLRHVDEFAVLTERMGYWVDMDDAYWTMDPAYVQSVWWSLKQIFDKGLLVQDHRVSPYCPRCGTGLSDHELAQGYEDVVDPSVYVRMPVTSGPLAERFPGVSLLVWTTTPWTLVSNTAVAVKPDATYQVVRVTGEMGDSELLVIAEALREAKLPEGHEVLASMPGRDLERTGYSRPFDLVDIPDAHYVILADYVTTEDGSGLVHQAPAFGADDLVSCRSYGLPVVNPLLPDGTFDPSVPMVGGMFFKAADPTLVADLEARGLMFRHEQFEHSYPHCWRCHTPLVYYAQPSWYIRTTAIKDALVRENEGTTWHPDTIKWGRYGDWLENNVDWALSRNRYWGTPLPIWRCAEDHLTCIGSLAELGELAGQDLSELDPHRPYVDDVTFACPQCAATATRVPEVIDGWYDSGAMPFAQWGYPHTGVEMFERKYPADFICEAIDQTRGWFYTLMAVGTLVFDQSSYRTVLCLGHILDDDGRKMSKHLGNILEPIPLMDDHGADAVRWFMLAAGSPWQARRVGHAAIAEVVRRTLLTYWNTVSFQSLYARTAGFVADPAAAPAVADRPVLDRWALARGQPAGRRGHRRAGRLRHPARRPAAGRLHRRPVQLVRAPLAAAVLGRRPRRPAHAARVPAHRDPADGPVHAVRHRAGVAGPVRDRPRRLGAPAGLAGRLRRPGRPRARRAGGPDPPTGGAGPRRPRRGQGAHPPAPGPRPGVRARLGPDARRAARPARRGAQRGLGGQPRRWHRRRHDRRAGPCEREGELPLAGPALRQGHPAGRGRHRRCGPRGADGRAARHRLGHGRSSTASRRASGPTTS